MTESLFRIVGEIGLNGFMDMCLMALLLYGLLVWLRRTRRAGLILGGILILGGVYLAAIRLELVLTGAVLKGFFAVFVITLVVIFQEELRHLFEQIAKWGLSRRLPRHRGEGPRLPRDEVAVLSKTLGDLSLDRIGALVVITGSDSLTRHVDGGIEVNGHLSEALLKSVFDPHSMGHDGAVIVGGKRIVSLGVHLPLSREADALGPRGTRHAAALGLSERTDALCIVVSEERGTISVAQGGRLEYVASTEDLQKRIEGFYDEISPKTQSHPVRDFLLKNYREKLLAVLISVTLWFFVAHRTQETVVSTIQVPVEYRLLTQGQIVRRVSPRTITLDLSGTRERLRLLKAADLKLELALEGLSEGIQMVPIAEEAVVLPDGVELMDFNPRQIMVEVGVSSERSGNTRATNDSAAPAR